MIGLSNVSIAYLHCEIIEQGSKVLPLLVLEEHWVGF